MIIVYILLAFTVISMLISVITAIIGEYTYNLGLNNICDIIQPICFDISIALGVITIVALAIMWIVV